MTAFYRVLKELSFPADRLVSQSSDWNTWDEDRYQMHEWLLQMYIAAVTENHERTETSVSYARNVDKEWRRSKGTVLWPEPMFANLSDIFKGLAKIKDYSKRPREGFSAADVAILVRTTHRWARAGKRVGQGQARWDTRLASSVSALMVFCFQRLYRMGDATCPQGETFRPDERFTRASVWFSEPLPDTDREMTLDPPVNKCSNAHTGRLITGAFNDECTNWPSAIDHMIAVDPVPHHLRHVTPLFRDTRDMGKRHKDGTFKPGGKPLAGDFMRRTIRALVSDNKEWFGNRLPGVFGLHSFRIGGLNAALEAGASYMECCSLGRWASASVLAYQRMPKAAAHQWERRVGSTDIEAFAAKLASNGMRPALISRRVDMLLAAKRTPSQFMCTDRTSATRSSTLSGFAVASKVAKQSTLKAWRKSFRRGE